MVIYAFEDWSLRVEGQKNSGFTRKSKMSRFDASTPVSTDVIKFLRDHIEQNACDITGKSNCYIYDINFMVSKRKKSLIDCLSYIHDQQWEFSGNEGGFVATGNKPFKPYTLYVTLSVLRTCLIYVFDHLGRDVFPSKLAINFDQNTRWCSIAWEPFNELIRQPSEAVSIPNTRFQRIVVVNKLWDTEYTTSFDRGLHAQADELGIRIDDRRNYQSMEYILDIRHDLDPNKDSILVYFGNNLRIGSDVTTLMEDFNFHVVTTAGEIGDIRQDSFSLGKKLAKQCLEDDSLLYPETENPSKRYVLVVDYSQPDAHEVRLRKRGIDTQFRTYIDINRLEKLDVFVDCGRPYNERTGETIAAIRQAIELEGPENIAAIFPRTERATLAAVRMIENEENKERYRHIRVYGEWLASTHLALLKEKSSPLYACCCTDPYYFARYAVRAASCRWPQPLPVIKPVLITKQNAEMHLINSTARIPEFFLDQDVRLNSPEYGWSEWMRSCCAGTYGPLRSRD
jgi:hypothetical protein